MACVSIVAGKHPVRITAEHVAAQNDDGEENMSSDYPRARHEDIQIAHAGEDLVIHDRRLNHIHSLNPTAAAIWTSADGTRDVTGLAADLALPIEIIEFTLHELAELDLLSVPSTASVVTRRQVVAKLAAAGIATSVLPVIGSITGADATAAASICTPCDPGCYDACLCNGPCDPACSFYDECSCDPNAACNPNCNPDANCDPACNPNAACDPTCPQFDICCADLCDPECNAYEYCDCDPDAVCDPDCFPDADCDPSCPQYDRCACDLDYAVCEPTCDAYDICACDECDFACESRDSCICDGIGC